ncbi:MAG: hypothetical protein HC852_19930 [Acaryochloridaceae cyanobacterium RU_4_10]|nr:hypothetical protein [Acaryochloridaceae cyanobacterium RU_4_10]
MKFYNPRNLEPNTNQFYSFVKDKISSAGQQSYSYSMVLALFQSSESIYRTLDFHTQESLAVFASSGKYLSASQEHDLVALTASYIFQLANHNPSSFVEQDPNLTEEEKLTLKHSLDMFRNRAATVCKTIGNPRWVES